MKRYLIAASAAMVAANPHLHKHRHLHERAEQTVTATVTTSLAFVVSGTPLAEIEACSKVAAGILKFVNPADASVCAGKTQAPAAPSPSAANPSGGQFYNSPPAVIVPPSTPSAPAIESFLPSAAQSAAPAAQSGWSDSGATGLNAPFPDGQIPCSTFPSAYGAVPVSYLNMGGWIGLQQVGNQLAAGVINSITTLLSGASCGEGVMCSYACPAGYAKTQWPTTQGASGQSVGGLSCSGGMLHLTNPASQTLCSAGMGGVQATNNANGVVAICRTDYPGTESETVPMSLQPGQTQPMNNPNAATGYQWQGKSTSAQYYLNPIGTSAETACQWGSAGKFSIITCPFPHLQRTKTNDLPQQAALSATGHPSTSASATATARRG